MKFNQKFDAYVCVDNTIHMTTPNGIHVTARIVADESHNIDDDDTHNIDQEVTGCNDEQQVALLAARDAWKNDQWFYCGVVLEIRVGTLFSHTNAASVWGLEANYPNGNNQHLTEAANEMLEEAIANVRPAIELTRNALTAALTPPNADQKMEYSVNEALGLDSEELVGYVIDYIDYEAEYGNTNVDFDMLRDAIEAYEGGAR